MLVIDEQHVKEKQNISLKMNMNEQSCHAPHSPHPPSGLVEQREFRIQLPGRLSSVHLFVA